MYSAAKYYFITENVIKISCRLCLMFLLPASESGSTLATKMPIFCSAPPLMIKPMSSPSVSTVMIRESSTGLSIPLGAVNQHKLTVMSFLMNHLAGFRTYIIQTVLPTRS